MKIHACRKDCVINNVLEIQVATHAGTTRGCQISYEGGFVMYSLLFVSIYGHASELITHDELSKRNYACLNTDIKRNASGLCGELALQAPCMLAVLSDI